MPARSQLPDLSAVERVEWPAFLAERFEWEQGEHLSVVGPTGTGKTTLCKAILPRRRFVVALATKPKDTNLEAMTRQGYRKIKEWPPPALVERALLWPKYRGKRDLPAQRRIIEHALSDGFEKGGWTFFVDELAYLCEMLRLDLDLKLIWQQGRSNGNTLVGCTQRPAFVPLDMYSAATHLFFFGTNDKRDLDRIGGIGSIDPATIRHFVAHLAEHDALYLNTRSGAMAVTRVK